MRLLLFVYLEPTTSPLCRVHDEHPISSTRVQVFAADSTDAGGYTRIIVPSIGGQGLIYIYVYVNDQLEGTDVVTVRSTDKDADGRTSDAEAVNPFDLNYDGVVNSTDVALASGHIDHGRRNALHGTLVPKQARFDTRG